MLWSTLHRRIGKHPLSFSQHNRIKAVIDGKAIFLDLKYNAKGQLCLVPRQN